jgi:triosephosphate isomerase (TIM)
MASKRRRPFVAGNWKMHLTLAEARELARRVAGASPSLEESTIVLVPPFTSLTAVGEAIARTAVGLGGQDLYWEDKGAFTGEVSGPMLKDAGAAYVIIGHSERRQFFGETDETVNRKAKAALKCGLSPIVCVGEVLAEREAGQTMARVDRQIAAGLEGIPAEDMERVIIAYEPVWAIGTGKTASPAQAEEVQAHIRGRLQDSYGKRGAGCAIIYGGSVKPANSYALFREENIDGFLVGGASLDADGFIGIVQEALRAYREEK